LSANCRPQKPVVPANCRKLPSADACFARKLRPQMPVLSANWRPQMPVLSANVRKLPSAGMPWIVDGELCHGLALVFAVAVVVVAVASATASIRSLLALVCVCIRSVGVARRCRPRRRNPGGTLPGLAPALRATAANRGGSATISAWWQSTLSARDCIAVLTRTFSKPDYSLIRLS
jgi:hypothetical protein